MPSTSLRLARASKRIVAIAAGLALILAATPSFAQEDVDRLDELKEERERIQEEAAAQAVQVNAAEASFEDVAQALDDINALVDLQEARLSDAQQAVASAEALVEEAEQRELQIAAEIDALTEEVADLAVASFTGESGASTEDITVLLLSDDPSEAARRRSLVEFQTGSLADGIDRMRALVAEAEVVSEARRDAVVAANEGRVEAEARRAELAVAEEAQLDLVYQAEIRLEARLSEAAFIAERDADAAAEIRRQEEVIASRIRAEAARAAAERAARDRANRPPIPTPDDITSVQRIQVHVNIADRVDSLLSAARNDGVNLSGWGYRSNIRQIELRQVHCGTSEYAVWEMPASACRPPTARPGMSNHERGLAIDFTYNGGSMTSRSNPGFQWLANHAADYGFVNLPSEPWHWSTDGN
ncbi:MAG: D-alanyl-D-alanine carboxypeptidase family protein [Acidimicrobiales bacterium]